MSQFLTGRTRVAVITLLMTLLATFAFGQLDTGTISGVVTDPAGAVVPGAQVLITQTAMNFDSGIQTTDEGLFRANALRPGPYRVTITVPGFKKFVRENIILRIGENISVDAKLEVGTVTESLNVTAEIPLLETQTSSTGQVMDGQYFYKLPNYQHWEKGVLYVTPNVQTTNTPWAGSLSNFHINGGQSSQIGYFEDGQLATAMDGGNTINSISASVEEVKVLSTVLPAEYGHSTTGAISVVKKTGTNSLHGSATWLVQTRSMVHRRFFELESLSDKKISSLFQQPDAYISGPVYIPGLYNGKNRTFFMYGGSFHFDSQALPGFWTVPTPEMLNGVFNFPGVTTNVLYDPASTAGTLNGNNWSRSPLPNNTIPKNRFSSVANAILSHNPFNTPNFNGTFTQTGPANNVSNAARTKYRNFGHNFRIDQQINDKMKTFISYTRSLNRQESQNTPIVYAPYDGNQRVASLIQQTGSVGFTYTLSPTLFSETRVGYYRTTNNPTTPYEMAITNTFVNEAKVPGIDPSWYIPTIATGFATGPNGAVQGNTALGNGTQSVSVNGNRTVRQDITKIWGSHSFKMGYEWLWQNRINHDIGNMRVSFNFGATNGLQSNGNGLTNTGGITLADLMLGYVTSMNFNRQGLPSLPENSIHSFYWQDDWRLLRNLTLNIGVRYSNESVAHMKYANMLSVGSLTAKDDVYNTSATPGCPADGCLGAWVRPANGIYDRDNNNFQPRFGLAWQVRDKTVIRGGMAFNTLDLGNWYTNQSEIGGGSFTSATVTQPGGIFHPLFQINQGPGALTPTFPSVRADGSLPNLNAPQSRGTLTVIPRNFHNPYTLNWNFSIQRALKSSYVVEATYSGSHNVGFQGNYNWQSRPYAQIPNPNGGGWMNLADPANFAFRNTWVANTASQQAAKPYASWQNVNYTCNCVSTIFHSGTAKIEKRMSEGLTFSGFYTLSKGLTFNPGNTYLPHSLSRGRTNFDQKHRFVSSMTYDLPFGKGKRFLDKGGPVNYAIGGWSMAWNYSVTSGTPINISISGFQVTNPATGAQAGRQDYPGFMPTVGGGAYLLKNPSLRDNWQDIGNDRFRAGPATINGVVYPGQNSLINCGAGVVNVGNDCITYAQSFTNGNLPVNSWDGHRFIAANVTFYKDVPIKERFKGQFRLDFYNPFKWYNWDQPSTNLNVGSVSSMATFGLITSLNDAQPSTNGGPPIINLTFALKW